MIGCGLLGMCAVAQRAGLEFGGFSHLLVGRICMVGVGEMYGCII